MPTKQANGKYKTNLRFPKEFKELTGITTEKYQKTFPSKQLAIRAENEMRQKIAKSLREANANALEIKGNMKLKDFFESKWLPRYILGQTGRSNSIPTDITIANTKDLFRLHILPMFGNYAINYLNANTEIISDELTSKSQKYANIKTLKSYINSIFDIAEILGYIEFNRTTKVIQSITSPKKTMLLKKREEEGKQALSAKELLDWINAVEIDFKKGKLNHQDYTLFLLTMYLGDRKSETYALRWKNICFENQSIQLENSLDKRQVLKSTKSGKNTIIKVSNDVIKLLRNWKSSQSDELALFNIKQSPEQFLFTYCKPSGEINCPVHIDYLNHRIKALKRRHEHLEQLTPHKLRHTFATLAKQGGADISKISEALTHSDISTTKIYVNTPNIVDLTVYNAFENVLKKESLGSDMCSKTKKETPSVITESAQSVDI
ncbi:site-specific integrase [uncultured Enterococcus sp.]|uniref:tyrosine-type recombinase/integrase n=1 Tax=uncultured Enterococcus sp. TaxID=167972 RepID=UPI002AA7DCAA|nr:site-specific integrase [uncultured Enterococcus sp.]